MLHAYYLVGISAQCVQLRDEAPAPADVNRKRAGSVVNTTKRTQPIINEWLKRAVAVHYATGI